MTDLDALRAELKALLASWEYAFAMVTAAPSATTRLTPPSAGVRRTCALASPSTADSARHLGTGLPTPCCGRSALFGAARDAGTLCAMPRTVLIVDDHAASARAAPAVLEAEGFHVIAESASGS